MAVSVSATTPPLVSKLFIGKPQFSFSHKHGCSFIAYDRNPLRNSNACLKFQTLSRVSHYTSRSSIYPFKTRASSNGFVDTNETEIIIPIVEERPVKFVFWVLVWASLSLAWFASSGDAKAAADSIKASNFGLKIANALRGFGWPAEAVVFSLATLPVLELRGAIPVGYWMQLKPVTLTLLSVLG